MEIDLSPLQKVRDYVGVGDSVGAVDLLGLLREARNQKHPDRFQDPVAKVRAEEEFKKLQELITNLDQLVQAQEAQLRPAELSLYKPSYQLASLERKVDSLENERKDLEQHNKYLNDRIKDLEAKLIEKSKTEFASEHENLRNLYKPNKSDFLKAGLLLAVSLIVPLFSKIEEVSVWIGRYSPFPISYINKTVFIVFLLIVALSIKKLFEAQFVTNRSEVIVAASFARSFMVYLEALRPDDKNVYFTESEAFSFIERQPARIWRLLGRIGFKGASAQSNARLTSLFLDMLLEKKLISISYASRLDRRFSVPSGNAYF